MEFRYSTADLAAEFGVADRTIRRRAAALGLGIDLEGNAGYRYTDADRAKLVESLRPVVTPAPRKKKRAA